MYVLHSKLLNLYIGFDKHRNKTLVKCLPAAIKYMDTEHAKYALLLLLPSTHHLFEVEEFNETK